MPITSMESSPFYQKGSYGGTWGKNYPNWEQSELFYNVTNIDQNAAWTRRLGEMGYGGMSDKDAFARSLRSRAQEGYNAATLENPELNWWDYLKDNFDLNRTIAGSSPNQRGERDSNHAPSSRWTGRVY